MLNGRGLKGVRPEEAAEAGRREEERQVKERANWEREGRKE